MPHSQIWLKDIIPQALSSSCSLGARFGEPRQFASGDSGLVGAEGFEPSAFCSRSKRATRLRYAPTRLKTVHSISYVARRNQVGLTWSPQNFKPTTPLPKRTRRHWAFRRTNCPINRTTEFFLQRFAAQCRLRAGSSPSSPLAPVCRFAPNEPRRSLGIPSQTRHVSRQSAHPLLHHVPKATSRAQPNATP